MGNLYGWVCSKCGFSWAIFVEGCKNCNRLQTFAGSSTMVGDCNCVTEREEAKKRTHPHWWCPLHGWQSR
jgi:hypothetical protein